MNDAEARIESVVGRHLGTRVFSIERARAGGNNRVFNVRTGHGNFAVKFYPPQEEDPRDRLHQEFSALTFMNRHGISDVPGVVAMDRDHHCGVYDWVAGEAVKAPGNAEVDAMIDLAARLAGLKTAEDAGTIAAASASCLNDGDALDQLRHRLARLKKAGDDEPELCRFLSEALEPAITRTETEFRRNDHHISDAERTISPSDFGFHNAVRRPDGSLVFIDFEYFGWDDAAKMICDVCLHPGMGLSSELKNRFFRGVEPTFDAEGNGRFRARVKLLYPVFGLIWCLILLNEFLPERWTRRQAARGGDHEHEKSRQLECAACLLRSLESDDALSFID